MPILEVQDLHVYYYTLRGVVKAVEGVNLSLEKGEVLGIAGESGSGKSTLAYSLLRLVPPPGRIVKGSIRIDGTDITRMSENELRRKIRWQKISMVFQGAANVLVPVYTVGYQIAEPLMIHKGMSKKEALERAKELLKMVGLPPSFINRYPHELSGGQKQRVVIAMALALNPDIVVADEPTTALDVVIQAQILNLLKKLKNELGISVIIISHDLSVIAELADKVAIMYAGRIVEYGPADKVFTEPLHPYTQALLDAIPRLHGPKTRLRYIPGSPPDLRNPPPGCKFAPRCHVLREKQGLASKCTHDEPPLVEVNKGHYVRCWLYA